MNGYVSKPIDFGYLISVIKRYITAVRGEEAQEKNEYVGLSGDKLSLQEKRSGLKGVSLSGF